MYRSVLILSFALLCSFRFQANTETDKVVMTAAEGQLPVFLAKIKPEQEQSFGFTEEDDMDDCTIGKPYRILVFNGDFYDNPLSEDKSYIAIRNEWRVPVMIKEQNRVLLTVGGNPGNYAVSDMGGTKLAKELQQKSKGVPAEDAYYLLRIPVLSADFFVHEANSSLSEAAFVPLSSAITAIPDLDGVVKPSYTLAEVEQMVKNALTKEQSPKKPLPKKTKTSSGAKKNQN